MEGKQKKSLNKQSRNQETKLWIIFFQHCGQPTRTVSQIQSIITLHCMWDRKPMNELKWQHFQRAKSRPYGWDRVRKHSIKPSHQLCLENTRLMWQNHYLHHVLCVLYNNNLVNPTMSKANHLNFSCNSLLTLFIKGWKGYYTHLNKTLRQFRKLLISSMKGCSELIMHAQKTRTLHTISIILRQEWQDLIQWKAFTLVIKKSLKTIRFLSQ